MYELDRYDEKILRMLLANSRSSFRDIASKVKLSKDAVRRRVSRYQEAGLLSSFLTIINQSCFAEAVICVMVRTMDVKSTLSIVRENDKVNWVAELLGDYDISFTYVTKELSGVKQEISRLLQEDVQTYQLHLYTNEHKFSRNQLFGGSWTSHDDTLCEASLDDLDTTILRRINDDARASYAEIAYENGVSGSTVSRHVNQLVDEGVIEGFTVSLKPYNAGFETYLLGLPDCDLDDTTIDTVAEQEEVTFFTASLGHYDYFLRITVDNQIQLQRSLRRLKDFLGQPGVDLHRVIDEPKEVYLPTSMIP